MKTQLSKAHLWVISACIGLSAFMLFWVQPLFAKQLAPVLGGVPGVWNTLLFFFQSFLLLGYLYSHFLTSKLNIKRQRLIHTIVALLTCVMLPVGLSFTFDLPQDSNFPFIWVFKTALVSVGLPFFMIATTAPLLQKWFSQCQADDQPPPYFLYAYSNIGSFIALLVFPFLLEPLLGTSAQLILWSVCYVAFVALIILSGYLTKDAKEIKREEKLSAPKIDLKTKLLWLMLAFIPSSLLHGVSVFITNDIAAIPLLWIIPLALYLISFVLPFYHRELFSRDKLHRMIPLVLVMALVLPFWVPLTESIVHLFIHLALFFLLSLSCHDRLRGNAPDAHHMTLFYVLIAVGGSLGGFFNAIISPMIFDFIVEYPLTIALACYFYIERNTVSRGKLLHTISEVCFAVLVFGGVLYLYDCFVDTKNYMAQDLILIFVTAIVFAAIHISRNRSLQMAMVTLLIFTALAMTSLSNLYGIHTRENPDGKKLLHVARNFYGIVRVVYDPKTNLNLYYNGSVVHAAESQSGYRPSRSYFVYRLMHHKLYEDKPMAIIGLGPGRMLKNTSEKNIVDFYEVNPAVLEIAEDSDLFTYFDRHPVKERNIIFGDGRLNLAKQPDQKYGLIISTAFNSNAIPFHLATKEAMELYLSKLANNGTLLFIAPANFFDFKQLFTAYAQEFDLDIHYRDMAGQNKNLITWFALTRKSEAENLTDLPWIGMEHTWYKLDQEPIVKPWTDDYYNIMTVIK